VVPKSPGALPVPVSGGTIPTRILAQEKNGRLTRGRIRTGGWAIILAAPFFVFGCSAVKQPANIETTRLDVAEMRREQTEMMALLLELRTRLDTQSQSITALKADTNLTLRELTEKLEALIARTEDPANK